MMPNHVHFEFLCALADSGQLAPSESKEFREHCQLCAPCRERVLELAQLRTTLAFADAPSHPRGHAPQGMRQRFVARAIREGIPLNERASSNAAVHKIFATAALVVLLIGGAIMSRSPFSASSIETNRADALHSLTYDPPAPGLLRKTEQESLLNNAQVAAVRQPAIVLPSRHQISLSRSNATHSQQLRPAETTDAQDPPERIMPHNNIVAAATDWVGAGSNRSPSRFPKFNFSVPSEIAGREPNLLTACACGVVAPLGFRSHLAPGLAAQLLNPASASYRTTLKPEFRADPATLQLIENVVQ